MKTKFEKIISAFFITLIALVSCGEQDSDIGEQTPQEEQSSDDLVKKSPPAKMPLNLLIRRIGLEIAGLLPTSLDYAQVKHASDIPMFTNKLSSKESSFINAAETIKEIWNLSNTDLLEGLIPAETTIADYIHDDTILSLVDHLRNDVSLVDLFSGNSSPISQKGALFFDPSSNVIPPSGFYNFQNIRPNLGIFSTLGLTSSLGKYGDGSGNSQAFRMLEKLGCLEIGNLKGHDFSNLSEVDLNTGIRNLSTSKKECASCHLQYKSLSSLGSFFEPKQTLQEWISYDNRNFKSGYYAGHKYDSEQELAEFIGKDPRVHQCMIKKMYFSITQHEPTLENQFLDDYLELIDIFNQNESIYQVYKRIPLLKSYEFVNTDINQTKTYKKFLKRRHYKSVAKSLLMSPMIFTMTPTDDPKYFYLPKALNQRIIETGSKKFTLPSEDYFNAVISFASQLSKKITSTELDPNMEISANARKVLKELPDGLPVNTPDHINRKQIASTWKMLTSRDITNDKLSEFMSLFESELNNDLTSAWEAIIFTMLVSAEFTTY